MITDWFAELVPPEARRWIIALLIFMVAFVGAVAWWMSRPIPMPEPPAPAVRQDDGSLILERKPDPAAKPKQQIPRRAKVERVASVTVQPDAPAPESRNPCPPVTVDLTLIREPDGARRILASSPNGQVVGGLDVPVEPITLPAPAKRWAAGLSWSPIDRTSGIWIERDMWRVRVGAELNQAAGVHTSATGFDARVRIGITF